MLMFIYNIFLDFVLFLNKIKKRDEFEFFCNLKVLERYSKKKPEICL